MKDKTKIILNEPWKKIHKDSNKKKRGTYEKQTRSSGNNFNLKQLF